MSRSRLIIFIVMAVIILVDNSLAQVASSTNYRLELDSINFAGNLSTSTNYKIEDTLGEIATGFSSSTNYAARAGYQQMASSTISITSPSDVTLSALTGSGASNSSVTWTVTTDNSAGYTLAIKAGGSPALTSGSNNFSDYAPAGANPDYTWAINTSASAFGFSVEGSDTASRYLDNGSSCGVGASNTSDQCWDGFSTSDRTIAQRASSNSPSGTATTVKLQAEVGSSHTQPLGDYTATLTVTATPQ